MSNSVQLLVTGDPVRFDESGLIPAIVQDSTTGKVLMLGYMNQDAIDATLASGHVTFFSRSKGRLWEKGETSGNHLAVAGISSDCDGDALLVRANPQGPTCHNGTDTCWGESNNLTGASFLEELERVIKSRVEQGDESSYTVRLIKSGAKKISQKVGEEGVETALEGAAGDPEKLSEEAADLLYHLLVLLKARDMTLEDVMSVLRSRHGE